MTNIVDIADPADPRLDDFRDLNSVDRRPDLPSGRGLVIAEGVLVVQRMLASRFTPHAMLGNDRRRAELDADLRGVDAPYYRTSPEVMADVVGFHLNRGVLAVARRPVELTVAEVLAGARTVAVLGAGCADPLYRRAVRVSMGHALLVPFARAMEWPGVLNMLHDNGFNILAMTPAGQSVPLGEAVAGLGAAKLAILVGAEGPGLTETVMRMSDVRVRIPMSRGTDSLNVATAAALAFYERIRLAQ